MYLLDIDIEIDYWEFDNYVNVYIGERFLYFFICVIMKIGLGVEECYIEDSVYYCGIDFCFFFFDI